MQTIEALSHTIGSIEDLQAVVRTMKALALVSIRQYEKARLSLTDYNYTIELSLQALLHHRHFSDSPLVPIPLASSQPGPVGVIIFGSDHGLCGQFNEQIVHYALEQLRQSQIPLEKCQLAAIGARLLPYLDPQLRPAEFSLPSSLAGIPHLLQQLLTAIEQWCFSHPSGHVPIRKILLFYNQVISNSSYRPSTLQLLPIDRQWLQALEARPWQSNSIPTINIGWESLFSAVVRQYLFVSLYRVTVESLASENAARLAAMQTAEKNIEERLSDLNADYRQQRQNSITEELLDIVSGFEALKKS